MSNAAVATVDGNGLATAVGLGAAYITAVNEGVTAVTRINVTSFGTAVTTVTGFVRMDHLRSEQSFRSRACHRLWLEPTDDSPLPMFLQR